MSRLTVTVDRWGGICLLPFHQVMEGVGRDPPVRHLTSRLCPAANGFWPLLANGSLISTKIGRTAISESTEPKEFFYSGRNIDPLSEKKGLANINKSRPSRLEHLRCSSRVTVFIVGGRCRLDVTWQVKASCRCCLRSSATHTKTGQELDIVPSKSIRHTTGWIGPFDSTDLPTLGTTRRLLTDSGERASVVLSSSWPPCHQVTQGCGYPVRQFNKLRYIYIHILLWNQLIQSIPP